MDDWFKDDFRAEVKTQSPSTLFRMNSCICAAPAAPNFLTKARGPEHSRSGPKLKGFFSRVSAASAARWIDGVMDSGLQRRP